MDIAITQYQHILFNLLDQIENLTTHEKCQTSSFQYLRFQTNLVTEIKSTAALREQVFSRQIYDVNNVAK